MPLLIAPGLVPASWVFDWEDGANMPEGTGVFALAGVVRAICGSLADGTAGLGLRAGAEDFVRRLPGFTGFALLFVETISFLAFREGFVFAGVDLAVALAGEGEGLGDALVAAAVLALPAALGSLGFDFVAAVSAGFGLALAFAGTGVGFVVFGAGIT